MKHLKYFVTKESGFKGLQLFVHIDILITVFKMKVKTILNGLQNNRSGKSLFYSHVEYPDGTFIDFETIPMNSILRLGLPLTCSLAYEELIKKDNCTQLLFKDHGNHILFENMKRFYLEKWPMFVKHYVAEFDAKAMRQRYAQNHSAISYILEKQNAGETFKNLFDLYKRLTFEELSRNYKVVFTTHNYFSFLRKLREAKEDGIKNALMHKSKGVRRNDIAVLSEADRKWVLDKKADQKNWTYRHIQSKLLKERGVDASIETIKDVIPDKFTKNLVRNFTLAPSYIKKNCRPTIKRVFNFPGDQYQGDGSKFQFICVDHTGRIISLTYYVVLDAYSRKIVGYSIDQSENSKMILNAFKLAFVNERHLPKQIVVDNGMAHNSKEMKKFIANLQHYGVIWTFCHKDYPLEKAEVESFFSVFQKVICSKYVSALLSTSFPCHKQGIFL